MHAHYACIQYSFVFDPAFSSFTSSKRKKRPSTSQMIVWFTSNYLFILLLAIQLGEHICLLSIDIVSNQNADSEWMW